VVSEFIGIYSQTESWVITGVVFFLGLTLGWFCKFNLFVTVIGVLIFIPVLDILLKVDHFFFNIPFILGFLVHTHQKILAFFARKF